MRRYVVLDRGVAEDGASLMLSLSTATRIFVALESVDQRQGFNGLYARVQSVLQQDPSPAISLCSPIAAIRDCGWSGAQK